MRLFRRWWWLVLVIPVIVAVAFVVWAGDAREAMPEALAALESDEAVLVDSENWLAFWPVADAAEVGFIFYPGGKVDARAYAPLVKAVAAQGYPAIIVPMPLNLAVFSPDKASDVMAHYPDIAEWVVGGHSLGGAMAARFAYNHPGDVAGLVLWASYPAESNDLSGSEILVSSIYGTLDGQAEKIAASRSLLPPTAQFVPIEGGNHAQFGWYGPQEGDGLATITRLEQQAAIIEATTSFLMVIQGQ